MSNTTASNIVFVVCHPDDETIWVGGLLYELSRIPGLRCHVICLSGLDPNSPREKEFLAARAVANYAGAIVTGFKLRKALQPLPDIAQTTTQALSRLGLDIKDVSLLITHSPYGDEQGHPHHIQAYRELRKWCQSKKIEFGYFSCIAMPYFYHLSLLEKPLRKDTLYVSQFNRVKPARSIIRRALDKHFRNHLRCPKYYLQFYSTSSTKSKMLDCYSSIDVATHRKNYISSTAPFESVYLFGEKGLGVFKDLLELMKIKENPSLFDSISLRKRIPVFLKRMLSKFF